MKVPKLGPAGWSGNKMKNSDALTQQHCMEATNPDVNKPIQSSFGSISRRGAKKICEKILWYEVSKDLPNRNRGTYQTNHGVYRIMNSAEFL